jgi:hypothetical protein
MFWLSIQLFIVPTLLLIVPWNWLKTPPMLFDMTDSLEN